MSGIQQIMLAMAQPKAVAYQTSASDATNTDAYTFSTQAIGAATAERRVIVAVHGMGTGATTISSVTIGGISATIVVQASDGNQTTGIVIAAVPTGTTADIVVTFSGTKAHAAIGVWRAGGLTSSTAIDSDSSTADPATATLTSVAGGFCIAAVSTNQNTTVSWSGGVTEKYDTTVENECYSGASDATTGTSITPSGDYAAGGTQSGVFATW